MAERYILDELMLKWGGVALTRDGLATAMNVFPKLEMLFIHDADGGLVAWWYHPNRELMVEKGHEMRNINESWSFTLASYELVCGGEEE